jgi:energy-coupling factor transporter ATP-binding protein EcfA2
VIVASGIAMQFGAKPLFEKVSVKFGGGNRYGLIGANGCGKSTFMKILGGELEPSAGTVAIDSNERFRQSGHSTRQRCRRSQSTPPPSGVRGRPANETGATKRVPRRPAKSIRAAEPDKSARSGVYGPRQESRGFAVNPAWGGQPTECC